jgi:hypothetical protein
MKIWCLLCPKNDGPDGPVFFDRHWILLDSMTGWWFGTMECSFPIQLGIMIPTDFHIYIYIFIYLFTYLVSYLLCSLISWEFHHPNWLSLTPSFLGVGVPPTRWPFQPLGCWSRSPLEVTRTFCASDAILTWVKSCGWLKEIQKTFVFLGDIWWYIGL